MTTISKLETKRIISDIIGDLEFCKRRMNALVNMDNVNLEDQSIIGDAADELETPIEYLRDVMYGDDEGGVE